MSATLPAFRDPNVRESVISLVKRVNALAEALEAFPHMAAKTIDRADPELGNLMFDKFTDAKTLASKLIALAGIDPSELERAKPGRKPKAESGTLTVAVPEAGE